MAKKKNEKKKEEVYIENEKLVEEFLIWREKWKELSNYNVDVQPPPSDYMVKAFVEIPVRFARTPKFNGYTYKDDLISAATFAILRYFWKFDPEISKNAFSFLTQITYFTFIAEIAKERKESYIKYVATNDFMAKVGDFSLEDENVQENVAALMAKHYNESMVAHHDGTVNKIKKHNKVIENSIENLICPGFDKNDYLKEY